jgi:hypothetical protein
VATVATSEVSIIVNVGEGALLLGISRDPAVLAVEVQTV